MPQIVLETFLKAPAEVCFDLIRDPRLHTDAAATMEGSNGIGQKATFESKQFGISQRLTLVVTQFERPWRFTDEMIEGNFSSFKHVHEFRKQDGGTLMRDTIVWTSPLGFLGTIVDRLVLERRLRNLVAKRNARLKQLAEDSHKNY